MDGGLLCARQDPSVTQERTETRNTEDKNKGGGPSPPSNHSLKLKAKKDKTITCERGILTHNVSI